MTALVRKVSHRVDGFVRVGGAGLTTSWIFKLLCSICKIPPALLIVSYASLAVAWAEPATVKIGEAEIIRNEVVSVEGGQGVANRGG